LRVHFASSDFEEIAISDTLSRGLIGVDNQVYEDSGDYDNDTKTDSYILVSWGSVAGGWPLGNGRQYLFTLTVKATEEALATGTAVIRFSATSLAEGYNLSAASAYLKVQAATMDVDGDGQAKALTDGLLILRYLFGFRNDGLVAGVLGVDATIIDAEAIKIRLDTIASVLDIDGDNDVKPLSDGLLVLRYLFGFRGEALVKGAVGVEGTRIEPASIESYLNDLEPTSTD